MRNKIARSLEDWYYTLLISLRDLLIRLRLRPPLLSAPAVVENEQASVSLRTYWLDGTPPISVNNPYHATEEISPLEPFDII